MSSYVLYEDPWAMQATILAALTADRETRESAIAVLERMARQPQTVARMLMALDRQNVSGLKQEREADAADMLGRRASHLVTLIVRFDGNVTGLRQDLVRQAPQYELALRHGVGLDAGPFANLDRAALGRLMKFLSEPPASLR